MAGKSDRAEFCPGSMAVGRAAIRFAGGEFGSAPQSMLRAFAGAGFPVGELAHERFAGAGKIRTIPRGSRGARSVFGFASPWRPIVSIRTGGWGCYFRNPKLEIGNKLRAQMT